MSEQPLAHGQRSSPAPFWGRSVRWRVFTGYLVLLLLTLLAALLTFWQIRRLLTSVQTLETASTRVGVATDVRDASTRILADVSRLLPAEDAELFVTEVGESLAQLQASQDALLALSERSQDEQTLGALRDVSERVQNVINISGTMVRQAENDQWPNVRVRVGILNRDQQQVVAAVNNLVAEVRATQEQALDQVESARRAALIYPALIGLLALGLAVLSLNRVTRSIAGPIERLTASAARLAGGAFDERVPLTGEGEFGQLALAFNQMAVQLQSYYGLLEERVAERTRDLALAAEVGQRLTQVHKLDTLLPEAVERIRQRFDLYYTQVYLMDPTGKRLTLYAGTGEVGKELAERGHHLALNRDSINGIAALKQEAVVIADTTKSDLFRPNPLLPETRSEIAVPLLAGERVLGVLDLQSRESGTFSTESLPAFEVLAGQVATAIENARLFQEVDEARVELAERRGQAIRAGWEAFLNAIDREEQLDATYANPVLGGSQEPSGSGENRLTTSITLDNEPIGAIELEAGPGLDWSGDQIEIVNSIAQQVAQQVENLRLLAEAQRYRGEAEEAIRRVTREGWEAFQEKQGMLHVAYQYNGQKVDPIQPAGMTQAALGRAIVIQGEPIGELSVAETGDEQRASSLVAAVADRLGAHIENLRLSRQTEAALSEAERRSAELRLLNRIVTEIGSTLDLRESLQIVVRELVAATAGNQARVALLNRPQTALTIVAEELDPVYVTESALGVEIPVAGNILTQEVLETRNPVLVLDPQNEPRLAPMHALFREQGIETMIILPILAGNDVIGTVGIDILEPGRAFTEEQERLASAIVLQAAAAIQNAHLFEQIQEALALTERLYEASERINTAGPDIDAAVAALAEAAPVAAVNRILLFTFELDPAGQLVAAEVVANWHNGKGPAPSAAGTRYEQAALRSLSLLRTESPLTVNDINSDERLGPATRGAFQQLDVVSAAVVPLWAGGRQIGSLLLETADYHYFTESEMDPYVALAGQLAVAVDRQSLVETTRRRAERERLINVIGQKIQGAPTIESAMQVAISELGQALKARRAVVELELAPGENGNSNGGQGSGSLPPGQQPGADKPSLVGTE